MRRLPLRVRRRIRRQLARHNRELRAELVHAAGCTHSNCATIMALDENLSEAATLGVRVPRSLRARAATAWGPPVCPGCYAVGEQPCAPGCIDEEIRTHNQWLADFGDDEPTDGEEFR